MTAIRARLVTPHQDLGPDDDYHEWIVDKFMKANCRGYGNPRMWSANWLKVICNNTDCAGWGLVNKAAVLDLLPANRGVL